MVVEGDDGTCLGLKKALAQGARAAIGSADYCAICWIG